MTLNALKSELRGTLDQGFLRRARSDEWLLISDYPRFSKRDVAARLTDAGWRVKREGSALLLDLAPARYAALAAALPPVREIALTEDNLPLYSMVKWLRATAVPPEQQPIAPLRLTLKYLGTREEDRLYARLAPLLAALLREGAPLPSAVAAMLTNEKEDDVC